MDKKILPAPGTEEGPCYYPYCRHEYCDLIRTLAAKVCCICNEGLDYERILFRIPSGGVHAVCLFIEEHRVADFDVMHEVITPAAFEALERNGTSPGPYLTRHYAGDWGDMDEEDRRTNREALQYGTRIMSVYELEDGTKIWVMTDGEVVPGVRYTTTVLLPEDY